MNSKGKTHLNSTGLQKIVNLRASSNRGLTDTLKAALPNTIPVYRPLIAKANLAVKE